MELCDKDMKVWRRGTIVKCYKELVNNKYGIGSQFDDDDDDETGRIEMKRLDDEGKFRFIDSTSLLEQPSIFRKKHFGVQPQS